MFYIPRSEKKIAHETGPHVNMCIYIYLYKYFILDFAKMKVW